MQKPCLIQTQIEGNLLCHQESSNIEYQLRTKTGTIAGVFAQLERAHAFNNNRTNKHGEKVAPLDIYRVTTLVEKI